MRARNKLELALAITQACKLQQTPAIQFNRQPANFASIMRLRFTLFILLALCLICQVQVYFFLLDLAHWSTTAGTTRLCGAGLGNTGEVGKSRLK